MILPFEIIEELRQRSGEELRLSSDIERLVLDIESKTGEHIGVNTMKRLLGYIRDEREPRESTLDIIARYLGYENWERMDQLQMECRLQNDRYSSASYEWRAELRMESLNVGYHIRFTYPPDCEVSIRYLGNHRFVVEKSENSQLLAGDEIEVWHIFRRLPLYVTSVIRNGENLGPFTAGKDGGLTALKILKEDDLSTFGLDIYDESK